MSCAMACRSVIPRLVSSWIWMPAAKVVTAVCMSLESKPLTVMFVPVT